MATALDLVGDRWALLVVRELLLGPRRFGELAAGLPGAATDVLTTRLRELEGGRVLSRTGVGRAQRYQLTACGRALRPVLVELARWGSHQLSPPTNPEDLPARIALTALVIDPPTPPPGLEGLFQLSAGGETATILVADHEIRIEPTPPPPEPVTAVSLTRSGLLGLLIGVRARQLVRNGELAVSGRRADGLRLADTLRAPGTLSGLHRLDTNSRTTRHSATTPL